MVPLQTFHLHPSHPLQQAHSEKILEKTLRMKVLIIFALAAVATAAVVQNLEASGDKSAATATSHKGNDTNVQSLSVQGGELGMATATVDKGNATETGPSLSPDGTPKVTAQNLTVSGNKAIGIAKDASGNGNTFQGVSAKGGNLSIASAEA